MKILDTIKQLVGRNKEVNQADIALDHDKKGVPMYKEDIIADILDKLETRKQDRLPLELQWQLNGNFVTGNQFCDIDISTGKIENQAFYDAESHKSFNRIRPLIETRIANIKQLSYLMTVKPRTSELDDYEKADISTNLLRYIQDISSFTSKKDTAVWWNEVCGSSFFLSWWDSNKGNEYARVKDVEIDENGAESVTERAMYEGDLDYGIITPYEIYPESIFKSSVKEQRSIIIEQVKSVEDIYDMYGIEIDGKEVDTFALSTAEQHTGYGEIGSIQGISFASIKDAEKVITYFERPSRRKPEGVLAIIIGETELVYYGSLPFSDIPIVKMVCKEMPGQFFGQSCLQELIPLQRAYNTCVNKILAHIDRLTRDGYVCEEDSIDIDNFEENGRQPGAIISYKRGSSPPLPIKYSSIDTSIITEKHELQTNMEYVAGVSQLMVYGKAPSGVTSGTAIENLRDIDNTRLALTGDNIRAAVKDLAKCWLEIYKKNATTRRVIQINGMNNIGNALIWSSDDINSFDIKFDTENELIISESVQKQRFIESMQMGLFTDEKGQIPQRVKLKALESMKTGMFSDTMNVNTLQLQAAQRENAMFERGVMPEVKWYDDNDIHIKEHTMYMLQMKYQLFTHKKPEYAQMMENHLKQHMQLKAQKEQEEIQQALSMQAQGQMQQ